MGLLDSQVEKEETHRVKDPKRQRRNAYVDTPGPTGTATPAPVTQDSQCPTAVVHPLRPSRRPVPVPVPVVATACGDHHPARRGRERFRSAYRRVRCTTGWTEPRKYLAKDLNEAKNDPDFGLQALLREGQTLT